ncbi:MAG: RNA polymerase sigma factor [Phycisphaerae bacterium]|nr:MAG: RNA polymerase sigma factor [Phycisphaerae bacterium]
MAATRAGDLTAYDKLVERHRRQAVSLAYRLLNRIEDASDVAQDAFVRAYQNLEKLDDPKKFAGWLMRIVTNLSLNFRKSRARHQMADVDETIKFDVAPRKPTGAKMVAASAEDSMAKRELKRVVRDAIDDLPEKQRTALTLFALEGLSQKEVATIMDCSLELVKWNVFQARKKLRTVLAGYVED